MLLPYLSTITDKINVLLLSSVPMGISFGKSWLVNHDEKMLNFMKCETPNWMPKNPYLYTTVDMVVSAPLGYASYIVCNAGGGFSDKEVRIAYSLYGVSLAGSIFRIITIKNRDVKNIALSSFFTSIVISGTAYAFFKVDQTAGRLMLPYAVWHAIIGSVWLYRALTGGQFPCQVTSTPSQTNLKTKTPTDDGQQQQAKNTGIAAAETKQEYTITAAGQGKVQSSMGESVYFTLKK